MKIRKNVMFSPAAIELGLRLANADHRNFSNMLEVLVMREAQRLQLT